VINENRLERAMKYLAETDELAAALRAETDRSEFKAKQVKATVFLTSEGTVAEREARALIYESTTQAYDAHFKAIREYHAVANKRALEQLVVELWRSINANRRMGNIT
jgi:hypothetical protein